MKTKMVPCEIETPDYRIKAEALPHTLKEGQVMVCIEGNVYYEDIPLDDITDDSRRLILNSNKGSQ